MLKRFINSTKDKLEKGPSYFIINIIGKEYCASNNTLKAYLLHDLGSGLTTWYPAALVQANRMNIEKGDCLLFSPSMYSFWFGKSILNEFKRLSQIALENFDKISENSSMIVGNKEFYKINFLFLQSHIKGNETSYYYLGDLLKSWLNSDKFRLESGNYMIKISVCFSSSNFTYLAWDYINQSLIRGKGVSEYSYKSYFAFKQLSFTWKNSLYPDIIRIMNLFDKLHINY